MNHITVIIPAYNVEQYIGMCLDSIIHQTVTDWICLVMDDGSTDNTLSVIQSYADKDTRIRVFSQKNAGVTKTRNRLLDMVRDTDYLFIMDADDFIHPKTFELLLEQATTSDADLVETPWVRAIADTPHVHPESVHATVVTDLSIYFSKATAKGPWINSVNKLYKWDKIKHLRFDEQLTYEDDFWFESLVHQAIGKKVILNVPLYYYRHNPTSITKSLDFDKYVNSGIRRIHLSYDTFVRTNRIPPAYQQAFMVDLTRDAYRMILQKNLKKNKNKVQRKELFLLAAAALTDLVDRHKIDISVLSPAKRMAIHAACYRRYYLTKLLVILSSF